MKNFAFAFVLTLGLFSRASELVCSAKTFDHNSEKSVQQEIKINPTYAYNTEVENGEVVIEDLKLSVFRNVTQELTSLYISAKKNAPSSSYDKLASSSANKLQAGQDLSLTTTRSSVDFEIRCSLK